MWEVGRDYWKNHPDMKMNLIFEVVDGVCSGWFKWRFPGSLDRTDVAYTTTKSDSLKLEQPPHTVVDKTNFEFTLEGAASQSFTILAEDSWTITDIPSWLHFHTTSGNATGSDESQVLFDVDENPNAEAREAAVTITSGRDNMKLEIAQSGK